MAVSEQGAHGRKTITANTPAQIFLTPNAVNDGILIFASSGNTTPVYVGFSSGLTTNSADATDGFPIAAGAALQLPVRRIDSVWVRSAASATVWWLAL